MPHARPPGGKGSSLREGPEAAVPRAATADSTATGAELGLEPNGYGHTHTHTHTHTQTHTGFEQKEGPKQQPWLRLQRLAKQARRRIASRVRDQTCSWSR